jgi:hypothetical protein
MKTSIVAVALTAGGAAALSALVPAAEAAPARASVTVTITAEGTDMSGIVTSSRPAQCAANRTVKVYKLVHGEPHLFASDTTDRQGGSFVWSTGNTGTEGRFFAKVPAKPGCKTDVSPTIRVRRNP